MSFDVLQEAKQNLEYAKQFRRHFHKNPELSFQEYKTSAYIKERLTEFGIQHKSICETGVVALIGNGEKFIALRADIDALPISEETDLEFASVNDGIMHACGHDFHMSILLTVAKILKQYESTLKYQVKIIFQPAEEKLPGGASLMIAEGVLEYPTPEMVFGLHINPDLRTGIFASASGPLMASADELYWTITGKQTHAAQPHLGNDPILASAQLIVNLQSLMTKFRDPLNPAVLSITSVHGGSATNIIPEKVDLMGTLRYFDNEARINTIKKIDEVGKSLADIYNVKCDFNPKIGYPPVVNHELPFRKLKDSIENLFGTEKFYTTKPYMWAEDFAYYGEKVPSCFFFIGVKSENEENLPPLHNSKLSPDENALLYGIAAMVSVAI